MSLCLVNRSSYFSCSQWGLNIDATPRGGWTRQALAKVVVFSSRQITTSSGSLIGQLHPISVGVSFSPPSPVAKDESQPARGTQARQV